MVIALHPDDTHEFVCFADRELPAAQQTVFILKPIPSHKFTRLQSKYIGAIRGIDELSRRRMGIIARIADRLEATGRPGVAMKALAATSPQTAESIAELDRLVDQLPALMTVGCDDDALLDQLRANADSVRDTIASEGTMDLYFAILREGLAGWRGFQTRSGAEIPFGVSDAALGQFPFGVIQELVSEIFVSNSLTRTQRLD
jgi:hypothetical protein